MLSADTLNDNEEALRRMVGEFAKHTANVEVSSLEEARSRHSSGRRLWPRACGARARSGERRDPNHPRSAPPVA